MNPPGSIFIFAPDAEACRAICSGLERKGYTTGVRSDPGTALELLDRKPFVAALLYLTEEGDGLEILNQRKIVAPDMPVLIATPAAALTARIAGLNGGADDHLIEPFGVEELLVRFTTVLSRRKNPPIPVIRRHGLLFDPGSNLLGNGEQWTHLTHAESQVFRLLFERNHQPLDKERLRQALPRNKSLTDNAIEVLIYRLRAKVQAWGIHVRAQRGKGYVLEYSPAGRTMPT